jgi:hypothetical protein
MAIPVTKGDGRCRPRYLLDIHVVRVTLLLFVVLCLLDNLEHNPKESEAVLVKGHHSPYEY